MDDRAGAINGSGLVLPSYVKVKASVEYVVSRHLILRAEADNLLDERYAQSSNSPLWIGPPTRLSAAPGPVQRPRAGRF